MYQTLRTSLLSSARCWDANSHQSYQTLFDRLDTNKDGKVDVAELREGLKAMGIFRHGAAQVGGEHDPARLHALHHARPSALQIHPQKTCFLFELSVKVPNIEKKRN